MRLEKLLGKVLSHKNKGEKIIFTLRRHWFTFLMTCLTYFILMITPIGIYLLLVTSSPSLFGSQFFLALGVLGASTYYLYLFMFLYSEFIDYYLDIWIVTTERIINIEQKGLFFRQVSEQKLYRIQDIKAESRGFFPTIFNYGNLVIQTAAEEKNFIFKQIPHVFKVSKKLNDMIESDKMKKTLNTST